MDLLQRITIDTEQCGGTARLGSAGPGRLQCSITIDTEQCGGRPGIRGMHIRVTEALDLLANGLSPEQAVKALPDLETDDIRACLRYASRRFDHPVLLAASSG